MPHKRSKAARERRNNRAIEYSLSRLARERGRDPRDAGLSATDLSRMRFGADAAERYTAESKAKDTRDGVMVKNRSPKRASDKAIRGSATVPDDLIVTARIWNAETDQRETIMVPAPLKPLAEPKSKQTRPMTSEEAYRMRAW